MSSAKLALIVHYDQLIGLMLVRMLLKMLTERNRSLLVSVFKSHSVIQNLFSPPPLQFLLPGF